MTLNDFRRLALQLPEAVESAHMGHPDFRVGGKIFATLDHPEAGWGMMKLPPVEQAAFLLAHPKVFRAANGAWGAAGATLVELHAAPKAAVAAALDVAWQMHAPKRLIRK